MLERVALVSLFSFSMACGDSGSPADAGGGDNGGGAQGSGADGSGAGNVEGGGSAGSGGAASLLPMCFHTCSAPADCASANAITDADNWQCNDAKCEYLGCLSDAECQETYASPDYVCEDALGIPTCQRTCEAPTDCATASPLTDADNWTCSASICQYLGCLSDGECQDGYANPGYRCDDSFAVPVCFLGCDTPADCASASLLTDADNWACNDHCEYLGCNSSEECRSGFSNPDYVCE